MIKSGYPTVAIFLLGGKTKIYLLTILILTIDKLITITLNHINTKIILIAVFVANQMNYILPLIHVHLLDKQLEK
jgi:hypothetical protein